VQESALSETHALHVLDYERASAVIRNSAHIGISLCYCRHKMAHVGRDCSAPKNICMTFSTAASSLIRHGYARRVDAPECIDLLEKAFVIFKLPPFARNLRNEINTSRKIYFYDNGIRNTLINNYAPLTQRNDVGALWENFVISERKKYLAYAGFHTSVYFWRNVRQAEIDYLEEENGLLKAFELKWNPSAKVRFPKAFMETYTPQETHIIHRENFWEYL